MNEEKFKKAVELVAQGSKRTTALKAVGLAPGGANFIRFKKMLGETSQTLIKKKKPKFLDLPSIELTPASVAVIVTTADNLRSVLKGLL